MDKKVKLSAGTRVFSGLVGLFLILMGIFLFWDFVSFVLMFFIAIVVHGFSLIIKYLFSKGSRNGWDLVGGIMNIFFGMFILISGPEVKVAGIFVIETFMAVYAIFFGIIKMGAALSDKKIEGKKWVGVFVSGILMLIVGILLLCFPILGTGVIVLAANVYVSILLISLGLTGIAEALSSVKTVKADNDNDNDANSGTAVNTAAVASDE
ncbi:MAG: DUF308 domain-containing protein [Oscillospiraceae bacterium]|nr:DUF308 domain-containing protein [Oscillospiraceae bacterium]